MDRRRAKVRGVLFSAVSVTGVFLVCALPGSSADRSESAVSDYEARLEEISKEILEIRRELEAIVTEVAGGEMGRVFVFLESAVAEWKIKGVTVAVDGKTVFSRAFTDAELDVLDRGLPLELIELRLPAGEHRVTIARLGDDLPEPEVFAVKRGDLNSWLADVGDAGVTWRAE
jgi:hypothetical protein